MVKRKMYRKIQLMKKQGLLRTKIAAELGIDRRTVSKYYFMSEREYLEYEKSNSERDKILDDYLLDILEIYEKNNFRKLNMTAVFDFLEEKYGSLSCSEKSFRNYINHLIQNGELVLKENVRLFDKVPPLPYGQQMQVDFGQYKFQSGMKVYIFASLLSASRYKYTALQDHPFKTKDVIRHLLDSFEYFGGVPSEMVIDQDAVLVVSENSGDIIYTKEFASFKEEMDMKMYVCRKADPQSKGKIENLVGFVKKNFLEIRDYSEITEAVDDMRHWLNRRANGKISQGTGLLPSELIIEERKSLRPLRASIFQVSEQLLRDKRIANKHSFISYKGSQYSVPKQYRNRTVEICEHSGNLTIYDCNGKMVAEHKIPLITGQKVHKRDHFRETEKKSSELKSEVLGIFSNPEWQSFVLENFRHFPRYVRDQCILAKKYFDKAIDEDHLLEAIAYCEENKTYSFKDLKDSYKNLISTCVMPEVLPPILSGVKLPEIFVSTRNVEDYETRIEQAGCI